MLWFIKPFRYLASALRDLNSPRRIAWGVALGMVVGLVPKDNLTAAALGMLARNIAFADNWTNATVRWLTLPITGLPKASPVEQRVSHRVRNCVHICSATVLPCLQC